MREAYDRWPDASVRRRYNQELVGAVLRRFLDGRLLLAKLQALGAETPSGTRRCTRPTTVCRRPSAEPGQTAP